MSMATKSCYMLVIPHPSVIRLCVYVEAFFMSRQKG